MKRYKISIFILILGFTFRSFAVDDVIASNDVMTMDDVYSKLETRLNLTDQQSEKFKPVFFEHREKLQNILKQHGMDLDTGSFEKKIGIRQLRAIKKDMDRLNRSTDNQLADILNKEQIKEYKKIQERQRDDLRDRLMNRR